MERELQHLIDRQAILDCLNRYCIGIDRHDGALIASAFFADAIDEHGPFVGGPDGLVQWANDFHSREFRSHSHCLTSHLCEIDGDVAHAQTYCLYGLARRDGETVAFGCARYVDRLERRSGVWRIALRKVLIEWRGTFQSHMPVGYPGGRWDGDDVSYQRPLQRAALPPR